MSRSLRPDLLAPSFVEREGGVFLAPRQPRESDAADQRPVQHCENEHNREHFVVSAANNAIQRFRENYDLARKVEAIWRDELARAFPERSFSLFVALELHSIQDENDFLIGYEIHPTLRLWSVGPGDEELRQAFQIDPYDPDAILSFLDGPTPIPLPLTEAIEILATQLGPLGAGSERALAAIRW